MSHATLLERLGGTGAIQQVATALYARLMADDEVGPLFRDTHMPMQRDKLAAYLVEACGGPLRDAAVSLRTAHAEHQVTDRHFSIMASHLVDLLEELGADPDAAAEFLDLIAARRGDVVSHSQIAGLPGLSGLVQPPG
ncbi:MAG: group 1 truncated hemoglobin [Ilumatobacteraceae bacterium]|nr:group 1 truncated hemoglobin [Ilumatobacter sp.]MCB0983204.1 group 1 truncated hemoglobin [Ilumatobacter sp.]